MTLVSAAVPGTRPRGVPRAWRRGRAPGPPAGAGSGDVPRSGFEVSWPVALQMSHDRPHEHAEQRGQHERRDGA
jgi:hypothetical protein